MSTIPSLPCNRCPYEGPPVLRWREMDSGIAHLGAYCDNCGAYIKWVPQHTFDSPIGENNEAGPSIWAQHAPPRHPVASEQVQ